MLVVNAYLAQVVATKIAGMARLAAAILRQAHHHLLFCVFLAVLSAASPAHAASNLLVNGYFDTPLVPLVNSDNIQGTSWSSWTGSVQINPIRVDGTGYGNGPDNADTGTQYIDLNGSGTISQTFTLSSTQRIYFGASFANRASANPAYTPPATVVEIVNSSNAVVATGSTVTLTQATGDEVWLASSGNLVLAAGTYTFRVTLGDYGHVDSAFVRTATMKVQKTTTGGFGGPFTFARNNLSNAIPNITTVAAGTATPASPTENNVINLGMASTITETPAAGFVLATGSCTDASSAFTGNTGSIGSLSGNVLTIPAANVVVGIDFTCVFTKPHRGSARRPRQIFLRWPG